MHRLLHFTVSLSPVDDLTYRPGEADLRAALDAAVRVFHHRLVVAIRSGEAVTGFREVTEEERGAA